MAIAYWFDSYDNRWHFEVCGDDDMSDEDMSFWVVPGTWDSTLD